MKTKNKIIGTVATVIILLVSSLVFVYYYDTTEENTDTADEAKVIDDQISPNENQALYIEILRIRNRDLMDKMLSYGKSWKEVPSFYYTLTVDDEFGSSKDFVGISGVYTTYDTMGYESSTTFDVEEDIEYSDVTISIIEESYKGLFGRRVVEEEVDKISLRYDYRTGRWTGDDYLGDKDGLGHYRGEIYEVYFNLYQEDRDHDGIPYWAEVNVLGTNPIVDDSVLDPDNDKIPTSWEYRFGYDPFVYNDHENLDPDIDGIQNDEEYEMRKYFANPFQPDIYIEVDHMEKKGLFDMEHIFYEEAQQMIIERFARYGINVYIDDGWPDGPVNGGGEELVFQANLNDAMAKQLLAHYTHNFADERKGIFRYMVVGDREDGGGFISPPSYNHFDAIMVASSYKSMLMRLSFTNREKRVMLAKAILHELGHSIGLMPITFHGNDIVNRRVNDRYPSMSEEDYNGYLNEYYSIMNYQYIYNKPFFFSDETHTYLFDYSDGSNGPPYDQNDWDHVYIPTFELDVISYEEPPDASFEDYEIHNYYKGVMADGWEYDDNLTNMYSKEFEDFSLQKNIDTDIQIFVKTDKGDKDGYDLRVYSKPNVEPVFAVYSLVAEGNLDSNDEVEFYSQGNLIKDAEKLIK